jgi:hypothetical protein
MKEKFAKLLLGEDITGGRNGLSPALALSNAITNLAGKIYLHLFKRCLYILVCLLSVTLSLYDFISQSFFLFCIGHLILLCVKTVMD